MKQNYKVELHYWPPRVRKPVVQVCNVLASDISKAISYVAVYAKFSFDKCYEINSATFTHWSKDKTCEVTRVVHNIYAGLFATVLGDHLKENGIRAFDYNVMPDGSVCIEFHDVSKGVIRISDTRDNPFGVKYKYNIIRDFPVSKTGWRRDGGKWRYYEIYPIDVGKPIDYEKNQKLLDKIVEQLKK